MSGYIPPSFSPFVWQDAPSNATPLKSSNLISDENNLATYIQSVITDYDSYARATFAIQGNLPGQIENAAYWLSGTAAFRPNASAVSPGSFYRAVDTNTQSVSDGVSWHNIPSDTLGVPVASMQQYAGSSDPVDTDGTARWLICDGRAISRTIYSKLFASVGTTYGSGNGTTTFNIPDMRQRFPIGKAALGTASTLGATGGAIDHTHAVSSLSVPGLSVPGLSIGAHSHSIPGLSVPGLSVSSHTHTVTAHSHGIGGLGVNAVSDHLHNLFNHVPSSTWGFSTEQINVGTGGLSGQLLFTLAGTLFIDNNTQGAGGHTHSLSGYVGNNAGPSGDATLTTGATGGTTGTGTTGTGNTGSTSGTTGTGTTGTGTTGTGTTDTGNPPYLVVNFIIRAL